ncbi:MAG: LapA family protein [Candidatus Pacebacteria bacterium]|nr:LapA family protein [Candidatus Paceibacterota bacterium]MBP9852347.1 LapA family protein [Candidatus Paceibacterota bacterium]
MLFIIGLLLGAVMVVFVLQNTAPVAVSFFGWHYDGSLALFLLIAIVGGMLVSALISLPEIVSKNFRLSKLAKHNRELSNELEDHKQKLAETEIKLAEAPTIIKETTIIEERP